MRVGLPGEADDLLLASLQCDLLFSMPTTLGCRDKGRMRGLWQLRAILELRSEAEHWLVRCAGEGCAKL